MTVPDKAKKKGFLSRFIEKLDKRMEEKAKTKPCCSSGKENKGRPCCSG